METVHKKKWCMTLKKFDLILNVLVRVPWNPPDHHSPIVLRMRRLKGFRNWVPIMSKDARLSKSGCDFSYLDNWRSNVPTSVRESCVPQHHGTNTFKGTINWAPIMSRGAYFSDSWCQFFPFGAGWRPSVVHCLCYYLVMHADLFSVVAHICV